MHGWSCLTLTLISALPVPRLGLWEGFVYLMILQDESSINYRLWRLLLREWAKRQDVNLTITYTLLRHGITLFG